jgi:putative DNA primase/helicase
LNVANGTIDLCTGELRPHGKTDLLSKMSPVNFDPDAKCPKFEAFLQQVFGPHPDVIPFLKRAIGYSLTGSVNEHVVFFLHGDGRNGKSTLTSIIQYILGPDYSHAANISTFMQSNHAGQGPNEGLTALFGKRFVSAQEPSDNRKYDVALLKALTGGDPITASRKFEHQFTFNPSHKLWIATNPPPLIPPDDPAIWARVKLIPFEVSFKGCENFNLLDELKAEASGILNWMIEGCREWQREGLGKCASVEAATASLRDENDQVALFIAERCDLGADYWERPQKLYNEYAHWATENGRKPLSHVKFAKRLDSRGFKKTTVHGNYRRNGLRLKETEPDYPRRELPRLKAVQIPLKQLALEGGTPMGEGSCEPTGLELTG